MANLGVYVAIIGGILTIIGTIIGGFAFILNKVSASAYDRGGHDVVHQGLDTSMAAAHDHLRRHDDDIAELKASGREMSAMMKSVRDDTRETKEAVMEMNRRIDAALAR